MTAPETVLAGPATNLRRTCLTMQGGMPRLLMDTRIMAGFLMVMSQSEVREWLDDDPAPEPDRDPA